MKIYLFYFLSNGLFTSFNSSLAWYISKLLFLIGLIFTHSNSSDELMYEERIDRKTKMCSKQFHWQDNNFLHTAQPESGGLRGFNGA